MNTPTLRINRNGLFRTDLIHLMGQRVYVIQMPRRRIDWFRFLFAQTVNYVYIEMLFHCRYIDEIFYFNKISKEGCSWSYLTINMGYGEKRKVRILTSQLMYLINCNRPLSNEFKIGICWKKYGF